MLVGGMTEPIREWSPEMAAAEESENSGVLVRLRAYLAQAQLGGIERLPPERELATALGFTRGELRKALAKLATEGQVWRHVGKGTFLGARPADAALDAAAMARRTNPAEVMSARLAIEPELARMAALNATLAQIADMRVNLAKSQRAATWRQYESYDGRLHRLVAEATQNSLLLGLFDTLSAVRQAVTWGRLRAHPVRPAADHHSFAEHEAIIDAIENRDMLKAAGAMRTHLRSVERNLLKQQHFEDPEAAAEDSSGAGIPRDHPDPPWPDSEANHGREIVR
jgi:GntR family transcriptional regulator, transcriptional repressor for pyruvate dehydrogenase complex